MEQTIHVLYFENDETVANMVKSILEQHEFSVRITANKINISDIIQNQSLPIILYSMVDYFKKELTSIQSGIDACINKDCPSALLLAKLGRIYECCEIKKHNNIYILSPDSTFNASTYILTIPR